MRRSKGMAKYATKTHLALSAARRDCDIEFTKAQKWMQIDSSEREGASRTKLLEDGLTKVERPRSNDV